MRRYWLEFTGTSGRCGGMPSKLGVTARSLDHALRMVRAASDEPARLVRVVVDPDLSEFFTGWFGVPVSPGIWYPPLNVDVRYDALWQ